MKRKLLLLCAALLLLTGCSPSRSSEKKELTGKEKETLLADCKEYVGSWLAANEPGAELQKTVEIVSVSDTGIAGVSGGFIRAVRGTYLKAGEEISFLYTEGSQTDAAEQRNLYVSRLPEAKEKEILSAVCADLPVEGTGTGLAIGWAVEIPLCYECVQAADSLYYEYLPFRVTAADMYPYTCHMFRADLGADTLKDRMPAIEVSSYEMYRDMTGYSEEEKAKSDEARAVRLLEIETYQKSRWRNHLKAEITLSGTDFPSHERELLKWFLSSLLSEAVFTTEDGAHHWHVTLERHYRTEPTVYVYTYVSVQYQCDTDDTRYEDYKTPRYYDQMAEPIQIGQ